MSNSGSGIMDYMWILLKYNGVDGGLQSKLKDYFGKWNFDLIALSSSFDISKHV